MMTKWEYTFLFWTVGEQCVSEINVLGQEGWELVSPVSSHDGILFVFKRPEPSVAVVLPGASGSVMARRAGNGCGTEGVETGVWLNPTQTARVLGLSPQRIRQLAAAGQLAHKRTPLGRLFSEETVRAAVVDRQAPAVKREASAANRKLTDDEVCAIYWQRGVVSQAERARRYGVSPATISLIDNGRRYALITGALRAEAAP
jgi:hypothetical protein